MGVGALVAPLASTWTRLWVDEDIGRVNGRWSIESVQIHPKSSSDFLLLAAQERLMRWYEEL